MTIDLNLKRSSTYIRFVVYYCFLFFILLLWRDENFFPNVIYRSLYLVSFFLPFYFVNFRYFANIFIFFYLFSHHDFSLGFFPTDLYIYFLLLYVGLFFRKSYDFKYKPYFILVFAVFIFIVDFLYSGSIEKVAFAFLIIYLLFLYGNSRLSIILLPFSFIISAFSISLLFLFYSSNFVFNYGSGLLRYGWSDANYFSMFLGMGLLLACLQLFNKYNLLFKSVIIITIIIIFSTLLMIASRGVILAFAFAVFLFLFKIKVSAVKKFIFLVFFVGLLYTFYTNGYFDLLVNRFEHDDGTGSYRTLIWENKLNSFFNKGSILQFLFGFGYTNGFELGGFDFGFLKQMGFHNDFIAFFVDYGLVGFGFLIFVFAYPIYLTKAKDRWYVIVLLTYLFLCCLTIEPLAAGRLPFFLFYYYILVYSYFSRTIKFYE